MNPYNRYVLRVLIIVTFFMIIFYYIGSYFSVFWSNLLMFIGVIVGLLVCIKFNKWL